MLIIPVMVAALTTTAVAPAAAAKRSLTIRIDGLPNNERADVRVTGPRQYSRKLTRSTTPRSLRSGSVITRWIFSFVSGRGARLITGPADAAAEADVVSAMHDCKDAA